MLEKKLKNSTIEKLRLDVERIMSNINTKDECINFKIKGLVIGEIQSGKTTNFAGLMSLAFDYEYHSIIVLSGMITDLRNQTSNRLNNDFGILSDEFDEDIIDEITWDSDINNLTITNDFKKSEWSKYRSDIKRKNFSVIKKNSKVLNNLIDFFKRELEKSPRLREKKFLIIDDEADQASIDISKKGAAKVSTINRLMCTLLALFDKVSYVGYTATPFANVLSDKNITQEGINLFPTDFVYLLKADEDYIGYDFFLSEESNSDTNFINYISEQEEQELDILLKQQNNINILDLNLELFYDALKCFILSSAIIQINEEKNIIKKYIKQKSMLINISSSIHPQKIINLLVEKYISKLKNTEKNELNDIFFKTFHSYFGFVNINFNDLKTRILDVINNVTLYELNTSYSGKNMQYINETVQEKITKNKYAYSIYIGGHKLSRGLTIEGLLINYFYRKSDFYDSAMQMCRWFGYRADYIEYTKIFTSKDIINKFINYFNSFENFKKFLQKHLEVGMSSEEIAYQIAYHPKTKPTASNKMKGASLQRKKFEDRFQIYEYYSDLKIIEKNFNVLDKILNKYKPDIDDVELSKIFRIYSKIPVEDIIYICDQLEVPTNSRNKINYIKKNAKLKEKTFQNWIIVIGNIESDKNGKIILGNYTYNLSLKTGIILSEIYKLKVILNPQILAFNEIKEAFYRKELNWKSFKGKTLCKVDQPVLFIFNAKITNDKKNISSYSAPLHLYAFNFPEVLEEINKEINHYSSWINNSQFEYIDDILED